MIRFACDRCGRTYSGADELAGQRASCRQCRAMFTVVAEGEQQSPPPRSTPTSQRRSTRASPVPRRVAPPPPDRLQDLPMAEVVTPAPQFNIDLDALSAFDNPAAASLAYDPLGPVLSSVTPRRRTQNNGGWIWFVFGGSAIAALAVIAIVAVVLIDAIGGGNDEALAYLPAKYTFALSIRTRHMMERANAVPQLTAKIEATLNESTSDGLDPRIVEEEILVMDVQDGYFTRRLSEPIDITALPGVSASGDSHQGMPIYTQTRRKSVQLPTGFHPNMLTTYCVMPTPTLLVGATTLERLKEAIDRAKAGRGGTIDLPRGYDLAVRDKSYGTHSSHGVTVTHFALVQGMTLTLNWRSALTFNADIQTLDASSAAKLSEILTSFARLVRHNSSRQSAAAGSLADSLRFSASGPQLRISGSIPTSQLAELAVPDAPLGR